MQQIIDTAKEVLDNYPDIESAYLHGSQATNMSHKDSDIDVALMVEKYDFDKFLKIQEELKENFENNNVHNKLDLSFITRTTDPLFAHQVFNNSQIIKDTNRANRLEKETLFELKYFDEQYFRNEMLKIVKERLKS